MENFNTSNLPPPKVHIASSAASLSEALGNLVVKKLQETPPDRQFVVALSGGSLPKLLWDGLHPHAQHVDWTRWVVIWADERCVPLSSNDSNFKLCSNLLARIPTDQVLAIDPDKIKSPADAAKEYVHRLQAKLGTRPVIDVALLGMGPDGHCCSLFPNHELLQLIDPETAPIVVPITDSPKPPSNRITITLPVVRAAKNVVYVVTGEGKREAVQKVLEVGVSSGLPAALARPTSADAHLYWFLDDAAAAGLSDKCKQDLCTKL